MSLRGDDNENDREAGKTTKKGKKRHVYWIKFVLVSLVILLLHVAPVTCVADNNTSAEGIAEVNSAGASKNLTVAQIRCTPGEGKTCPEKISSEKKGVGSTGPKKADDVAGTPQNLTTVVPPLSVGFVNRDLEYEIGKELGLRNGKEIPTSVVQSVIRGADQGNRDSLYFLGLLKLYGVSVTPDSEMALDLMRKAAEARHPEAMAALGVLLLDGRGGSRDYKAAVAWLKLSASEGYKDSMWLLGRMYYEGKGVDEVDFSEAQKWFRGAADAGCSRGQHYMGVLHEYGLGVEKNQRRAAKWHFMAANQGLPESHYHLGLMKAHGRGFSQDFSGAAIHFQQAARQNHAPSMMYLGKMFLFGHGFSVDYDAALLWFERAAKEGSSLASTEAAKAADELRYSLLKARRVNDQLAAGYDYGLPTLREVNGERETDVDADRLVRHE